MSNPTTNFLTGGVDLSSIFMPLSQGSAYSSNTGYTVNNTDLRDIFAKYVSGTKANPTGYTVNNIDLNNIFAKYSQVGIQWNLRSAPFYPENEVIREFATGGNYWIGGTEDKYYYSNDGGVSWNTSSFTGSGSQSIDIVAVAGNYDGSLFCMSFTGTYFTSTDGGNSWTNRGRGVGDSHAMVYSNNIFITVFTRPFTCLASYSTDGITWNNSLGFLPSNFTFLDLATDGTSNLVTIGYYTNQNRTISAYSTDNGQNWNQGSDIPDGNGDPYYIAYGNGIWVATTPAEDSRFVVSNDGKTWTKYSVNLGCFFSSITFNPTQNLFYAAYGGGSGITNPTDACGIYKSTNGQTWSQVLSSKDYAPWILLYNEYQDKFMGVGQSIAYSYTSI